MTRLVFSSTMSVTTGALLLHLTAAALAPASTLLPQDTLAVPRGAEAAFSPEPRTARSEWNDERVLLIIQAAIEARRHAFSDSSLRNFEADAEGFIYLLTDIEGQERLIRADQVALRIAWQAPGNLTQTILGRRSDRRLPSRIRYHIDHLAVTIDNFGDVIRVGEGDEVRGVVHPVARAGTRFYEYRLVDSTEIRFQGGRARIYEIEVRPTRFDRSGIIGTLYIDRDTWAVARMAFTFTPRSYVDPRLTGLDVDISNALWEGRYWLPVLQIVDVRRESRWLSFPISATIRTEHHIGPYRINGDLTEPVPRGEKISSVAKSELASYDEWRRDLLDGPLGEADTAAINMEEIRAKAREIVGRRVVPTGRLRVWIDGVSSLARGRRAEGFLAGAGGEYALPRGSVRAWVGYPFGTDLPELLVAFDRDIGSTRLRVEGYHERLTDVGPFQAAAGLVSSISLAINGEDFTDPYFRDGARATLFFPLLGNTSSVSAGWESQERATLATGVSDARPVRPIQDGSLASVTVLLRPHLGELLGAGLSGRFEAEVGVIDDGYARWILGVVLDGRKPGSPWTWKAELGGALAAGTLPAQRLVLLAGRHTVPGYPFRPWGGDQAFLLRLLGSRQVLGRWLNVRAFATAGWVGITSVSAEAAERFGATRSDGLRPSLGVGIGFINDALRVDVGRGLDDGVWEWMVSVNPDIWPML
ncbi:MAG: hypothetical protein O6851_05295 [Gemmatimonadetes bacterium]|nr:hypothetical protein [Gemmatimonadota bacterium]